jgi:hypothetical protein
MTLLFHYLFVEFGKESLWRLELLACGRRGKAPACRFYTARISQEAMQSL